MPAGDALVSGSAELLTDLWPTEVVVVVLLETKCRCYCELWWKEENLPLLARPWRALPSHPSG